MIVPIMLILALSGATPDPVPDLPKVVVGETDETRTRLFSIAGSETSELSSYPSFGGNISFSFDLTPECKIVMLTESKLGGSTMRQVVVASIDRDGKLRDQRVVYATAKAVTNPRWSPQADSIGFIEDADPHALIKVIDVRAPESSPKIIGVGSQFQWRTDSSVLVYSPTAKRPACHKFTVISEGKVSVMADLCGGINGWIPSLGRVGPSIPALVLHQADDVELSVAAVVGNESVARTVLHFDSPILYRTTACEKGISFGSTPTVSLSFQKGSWGFVEKDVCGAGNLARLNPLPKVSATRFQKVLECRPSSPLK